MKYLDSNTTGSLNRRQFLGGTLAATMAAPLASLTALAQDQQAPAAAPKAFTRKIKVGVIGNGGRGAWIAKLFEQHGGYELHAVADYFPEVADKCGDALGVDKARRFSTLSGYKRLIESGVEAVVLETPPYFFPEHASAAVEAGLHVYMAKPVAVDVPGAMTILAAGKKASAQNRCFLVDFQIPVNPHNIEIVRRIHAGEIGEPAIVSSRYCGGAWPDPPLGPTIENRLQHLIWCNDIALGGSHHVNACIHAVDAVVWALGKRPVSASGFSRIARKHPHGDSPDVYAVSYEYDGGPVWSHCGLHVGSLYGFDASAIIYGFGSFAELTYEGQARLRGPESVYSGQVTNWYEGGAVTNIAAFYRNITEGHFENPTASRSVDSVLTTIMSREAAMRGARLTMADLVKENRRLEVDLKGLKT